MKEKIRLYLGYLVHILALLVAIKVLIVLGYGVQPNDLINQISIIEEYALLFSFWVYVILSFVLGSFKLLEPKERVRNIYLLIILFVSLISTSYTKWLILLFVILEFLSIMSRRPLMRDYITFLAERPSLLLPITFAVTILLSALLLTLPSATQDGHGASFIDAIFTTCSATCVTGLIVQDTERYWTFFGQIVILAIIQIGGLGIMTLSASVAYILGYNIGLRGQLALRDVIESELSSLKTMVVYILKMTFVLETIGAGILSIRFYSYTNDLAKSIYSGIFHSISAFNNAGFSIYSNNLESFTKDPFVLLTIAVLIIIGGLGFMVVYSIQYSRVTRLGFKEAWTRLNLHSKLTLVVTLWLILGGTLLIYFFEADRTFMNYDMGTKWLSAFFQSVTLRTAGFNSVPFSNLHRISILIMIIWMFIGAGSGSTAGGIKVSTFGILFLTIKQIMKGKSSVEAFNRTIPEAQVFRSVAILTVQSLAFILIYLSLLYTQSHISEFKLLFESVSALGTVGLSLGITSSLTAIGKAQIVMLMFLGRVGPLTVAAALLMKHVEYGIKYPKGRVMVG